MRMATKIIFLKKTRPKSAILFTGLPGIGLVGKIAIDHLIMQLKPEKIAEIVSDSFPPSIRTQGAILDLIKDEIYYVKVAGKEFLFLAGPVQPTLDFRAGSAQEHFEFAEAIVKAVKELNAREVYTLAGLDIRERRMNSHPKVIIAATSKKVLESWKEVGVVVDKNEGLISGAAGLIIGIAKQNGIEGACLMGETSSQLYLGDHGSAKAMLELLVKKFKFKLNLAELEKEAKNIEEAFSKLTQQLKEQVEQESPNLTYVR